MDVPFDSTGKYVRRLLSVEENHLEVSRSDRKDGGGNEKRIPGYRVEETFFTISDDWLDKPVVREAKNAA